MDTYQLIRQRDRQLAKPDASVHQLVTCQKELERAVAFYVDPVSRFTGTVRSYFGKPKPSLKSTYLQAVTQLKSYSIMLQNWQDDLYKTLQVVQKSQQRSFARVGKTKGLDPDMPRSLDKEYVAKRKKYLESLLSNSVSERISKNAEMSFDNYLNQELLLHRVLTDVSLLQCDVDEYTEFIQTTIPVYFVAGEYARQTHSLKAHLKTIHSFTLQLEDTAVKTAKKVEPIALLENARYEP